MAPTPCLPPSFETRSFGSLLRMRGYLRCRATSRHLRELRAELQAEHARRVAAENVAFRGLAQERQIVDRARQVEVPVRIVRRIKELRLRLDHAERGLER